MRIAPTLTAALTLACAGLLTACGGGGWPGDGQTPLSATPTEVALTSSSTSCPPAAGPTVYAIGGTAPYTIRNPSADLIGLSTETIANTGDGVKLSFRGGCFSTIPLTFIDRIGNTVSVSVSYAAQTS